eukprot:TRINITY_DN31734_c0_g1_i1.p1 TRINITY_DN31734_c0_g1~~TRINITY_DN31734_c0_g1_i1.p1  ORF type:complete len:517 (-),score=99.43 TRINITY_DN31734_c0_g1_i1:92-1642(-)
MGTLEELQRQLEAKREQLREESERTEQLLQELKHAGERQEVRREIEDITDQIQGQRALNEYHREFKKAVDEDEEDHEDHEELGIGSRRLNSSQHKGCSISVKQEIHFASYVSKAVIEWKMHDMSWLESSLLQDNGGDGGRESPFMYSESVPRAVGSHSFYLKYAPTGKLAPFSAEYPKGSLALCCLNKGDDTCINLRYRFLVKDSDGEFKQWGEVGHETSKLKYVFGPDVQRSPDEGRRPFGIFGLSHHELLKSRWVQNDNLTVRVEVECKERGGDESREYEDSPIEVPPTKLTSNLVSLLESEKLSDISFLVQGEKIAAHSQILSARSDVFERELASGMSESVSKEIVVDDCDGTTFRFFLKFLYTDDLAFVEQSLKDTHACPGNSKLSILQGLLATSHKYGVARLQAWCEQKLCHMLSVEEVCSILRDAHLYGARQLEKVCLSFLKENMASVAVLPAFSALARHWPEISLKLHLFTAGVAASSAELTLRAFEEVRKRPAEEVATESAKRARGSK